MEEDPLANLAILEDSNIQDKQEKPLQKLKIKKGEKPMTEDAVVNETPKQKRERSEKQIEITKKMIEKRNANILVAKEKRHRMI
jgi:predicted DNA-binding antitoxin AbrB/MazE fold protein